MESSIQYLILGSGLSALSFAALMAKSGKKVKIIEAHDCPGGYGHTFVEGNIYRFNAQLHYVWNCGKGQLVNQFLQKLKLDEQVTFEQYDSSGYDHMRMPGYALDIPYQMDELIYRLQLMFPKPYHKDCIKNFITTVQQTSVELNQLPDRHSFGSILELLLGSPLFYLHLIKYRNATLQEVFDEFRLPLEAQTLLALQWPDFMLPPRDLSFFAWVSLFMGYNNGAYYPTKHFEHFVNSLVKTIEENEGEIIYNQKVTQFIRKGKSIIGVYTKNLKTNENETPYYGENIICNIDPKKAAEMIGVEHFSTSVQKKLNYDYSPSNFVAYCVVKDLDLSTHGFGRWNLFHSEQKNLNQAFDDMYWRGDYSKPSFVITTPGLLTADHSDCPEGCQILGFLTVANYDHFHDLKIGDTTQYRLKKTDILKSLIDITEKNYIPELSKHLVFKMTGSPTTNQRFCGSPMGNSYGSNLTPKNLSMNRLTEESSLRHFYFCNASSGFPGFAGSIKTGSKLYEKLSGDSFIL